MANEINITDLSVKAAAALTTADYLVTFTDDGNTTKTPAFEAISQANTENGCLCVKVALGSIPTAQVLTGNTTPIPLGITVPSGKSIMVLAAGIGRSGGTTAYATNLTVGLRYVGSTDPIATLAFLGRTIDTGAQMTFFQSTNVGNSQIETDVDLEIYVLTGNPTLGDFDLGYKVTYIIA